MEVEVEVEVGVEGEVEVEVEWGVEVGRVSVWMVEKQCIWRYRSLVTREFYHSPTDNDD